jgi:hypothetical protein
MNENQTRPSPLWLLLPLLAIIAVLVACVASLPLSESARLAYEVALAEARAREAEAKTETERERTRQAEIEVERIGAELNAAVVEAYTVEAVKAIRDDRRIAGWTFVRATAQEVVLGLLLCCVTIIFTVLGLVWVWEQSQKKGAS